LHTFGPVLEQALLCFLGFVFVALVCVPGHGARAAIGFVQVQGGEGFNVASVAATFNSNVTSGNIIGIGVIWGSTSLTLNNVTATCVTGNFTLLDNPTTHSNNITRAAQGYGVISKSGSCTVTANFSGSSTAGVGISVHEVSGVNTSTPLDGHAMNVQALVAVGSIFTSGNITTSQSKDYMMGTGFDAAGNGTNFILLPGAGFTLRKTADLGRSATEDKIQSSAGSIAATFTNNGSFAMDGTTGIMAFEPASGLQVSSRSDTLSDSRPSATSNHTFAFTVNNSIVGSSASNSSTLTLIFDPAFQLPVGMDCGDIDAATSVQFGFNYPACKATATAWGFSATGSVITLVPPSGTGVYVPTSTQVTINIGSNATVGQQGSHWITNPSSSGIYTISVGGTFGGSGNMLVSINSGVTVQATVAESLALTVSSVAAVNCTADDGASVTAIGTTSTTIPFGNVSLNTFYIGC